MELRFVKGNFGTIKYKLQYREFDMHNQITEWKDVPCVDEELVWCEHWKQFDDDYGRKVWKPRQPPSWDNYTPDYCPWCGVRRP